jgi:UDP-N-acetyl-alpha-D-muramoyl-L-alanyl-L-glutamate epimerase
MGYMDCSHSWNIISFFGCYELVPNLLDIQQTLWLQRMRHSSATFNITQEKMNARELRKKYPEFIYKGYSYELKNQDLEMSFDFEVPASPAHRPQDIRFRPIVVVKNITAADVKRVGESAMENLVFHLGLAEIPSYWKTTASPKIKIEAGSLNKSQINWWHDLFIKGMGEYFYRNKIDFTKKAFLTIESRGEKGSGIFSKKLSSKTLVPIGGGKDAIVTYETLKAAKQNIKPFVVNPKKEQRELLQIMEEGSAIVVERTIDSKLLELNRKGYLNGHTPFSAYLAFLTTFCAALFNYKYIVLSNERSSNEWNVEYLGHKINHQYSKSFEFEKKFQQYNKKYLMQDAEYFSFLRPLYELQIAKLFSEYPKYFATFLSCNEAHKTNSGSTKATEKWCGKCSKCLFVFAALYPFVDTDQLTKVFGANLFEDQSLIPLMEELVGERNFKPFECVGTTQESLIAFYLSLQKTHPPLPVLLKHFRHHIAKKYPTLQTQSKQLLLSWNKQHALPSKLEKYLHSVLK